MNDAPPIAVFVSGSGRSLANLLERASLDPDHPKALGARVARVIASRPCRAEEIAREAGVETHVVRGAPTHEQTLNLTEGVELSVLAGYLRLLPIPPARAGRVINIHPALLPPLGSPEFGGKGLHGHHVHARVIDAFERRLTDISGCTVHHADDTYDTGEVILQRTCPIHEGDTPETLAARVFALELDALPDAINQLLRGNA